MRRIPLAFAALLLGASATATAADGALDPGFGSGGRVMTDFGNSVDIAHAVAQQADGKLVVVGETYANNDYSTEDFAVARYNADGTLDGSFGSGGKVRTDFPGLAAVASSVAIQPDGKIVVAGGAFPLFTFLGNFEVVRYNADGSLDTGFGNGGIVTTHFPGGQGSYAFSVALQPDGAIVVGGTHFVAFSSDASSDTDFALARYAPDGRLDASFGSGGLVTTSFGGNDDAFAVLLQPDGRIVAVGDATFSATYIDFALARYGPDGRLDPSFGSGGKVHLDFGSGGLDQARSAVLQPDGRIVAAGTTVSRDGGTQRFAVARFNADGTRDSGFSRDGRQTVDFGSCCQGATQVLLQADGKLVLAGYPNSESSDSDFLLARLRPGGTLDKGFGSGGTVRTSFGDLNGGANAALLQADGKIVAVGFQATNTARMVEMALARYLNGTATAVAGPDAGED